MRSYIHLIRHGKTTGNVNKLLYGAAELELAEEGIEALKKGVSDGKYPCDDTADFYTTGMIRTEQTFRIIYGDRPHRVIKDLKEMNFGVFENRPLSEVTKDPLYLAWAYDNSFSVPAEGGESLNGFIERVMKGFDELMGYHRLKELSKRHNGEDANSIVVCHGGTIMAVMSSLFPDERKPAFKWVTDPGNGYRIELENGQPVGYSEF